MKKLYILIVLVLAGWLATAQPSRPALHAHNDYVHPIPFLTAYYHHAGSIEADVFLVKGELVVAHTAAEVNPKNTLEKLYLKPLDERIRLHEGKPYARQEQQLVLMIDLKSEGVSTLQALVKKLREYPALTTATGFRIIVSGQVPAEARWSEFPTYIYFDGRPGKTYSEAAWLRIGMISQDFGRYTRWNGKGILPPTDRATMMKDIEAAHQHNKPFRFWATPDALNTWITLLDLGVDFIGTDHIESLADFLDTYDKSSFKQTAAHTIYTPQYRTNDHEPVRQVILLIGDGMGLAQQYAGFTAAGGNLNLFQLRDIGFSVTTPADGYITDSAAGATAMATGTKTNNRYVGVDASGKRLTSITEICYQQRWRTAVISAGDITDATPAAFYAHQPEREWSEAIAAEFVNSHVNWLIGGGSHHFVQRKDQQDISAMLRARGYSFSTQFNAIDTARHPFTVIVDNAAVVSKKMGRGDFLVKAFQQATATLGAGNHPFFMMAEGAQIDYGGHANDMETVVREMLDFDALVGEALRYADTHPGTLVVITADHETGGLSLVGGHIQQQQVLGHFSTNDHTAIMVPVYAYGAGASRFRGVYPNTALFDKIVQAARLR